jgi:hypothetical protein
MLSGEPRALYDVLASQDPPTNSYEYLTELTVSRSDWQCCPAPDHARGPHAQVRGNLVITAVRLGPPYPTSLKFAVISSQLVDDFYLPDYGQVRCSSSGSRAHAANVTGR